MSILFNTAGTWYKGNLHMHTTNSDGSLSPQAAAALYKKAGYDFIALTDHWVQSENVKDDGFLFLSGCEWDTGDMVRSAIFHIIGVGMERQVLLKKDLSRNPQVIIDAINEAGGIAILAHPAWSVTDPEDGLALSGLSGAEIYNSFSGLPWNGRRADSSLYFDLWANRGRAAGCFAADDCHVYGGEQTKSYIMVNAPELTANAVKKSITEGNFYASQGPVFQNVRINGNAVEVDCSEVESVVFYTNTVWCGDRVCSGSVTTASYRIKSTDRYVRVELVDRDGNMAWTAPFFVNQ